MTDLYVQGLSPTLHQGVLCVEKGEFEQAWRIFSSHLQQEPNSAISISYLGMLMALKGGQLYEGLEKCLEAAKRDPHEALIYLNLSRCYLAAGDRYQAIRAIHKGLKMKSPHQGILVNYYKAMGMRRKPVLRFLNRNNPLNVMLGRITWRFKGRDPGFRQSNLATHRKNARTP
jgi:tetratricopeptide (TPR) repeat protein